MSEKHDIVRVLAAVEEARKVLFCGAAEGMSDREALSYLRLVLDDNAIVDSLSRLQRRPISKLPI